MENKSPTVLMIATRDTKQQEAAFIRGILEDRGVNVIHLDASIRGQDNSPAEINPTMIAASVGRTMDEIRSLNHEGKCLSIMLEGAIHCARDADEKMGLSGIIGIGGSMGTVLSTAVMRTFRYGLPKVMISTMASGYTKPFVGSNDIMMVNPVCDISGFNSITEAAYRNGALAIAAQAKEYRVEIYEQRPLVVMSTLSTTDPCTVRVRRALEARGFEVMVFHTLGSGGMTMEEIITHRNVSVVVDASLLEINDFLHGGLCGAGPDRCRAALRKGVPTIFVPGNIDFICAGPIHEARHLFPGKRIHMHNSVLTAVRSDLAEFQNVAKHMGTLISDARGPVSFFIPLHGFSEHDSPRGHLYEPSLPPLFSRALKAHQLPDLDLREFDCHINDQQLADAIIAQVIEYASRNSAASSNTR